jgi:hypothetical protein
MKLYSLFVILSKKESVMDISYIISLIVAVVTILGFVYTFLRNFKMDIGKRIDELEKRMSIQDDRIEKQNMRLDGIYTILLNNSKK